MLVHRAFGIFRHLGDAVHGEVGDTVTAQDLPGGFQEQLLALQEITLSAGKGGHMKLRHGVTIRHILHWASQKSIRYAVTHGPDSGNKV